MEGYEKVYNPNRLVYTGPEWLFNMFNGYQNKKKTATLSPIIDPDGVKTLDKISLDRSKDFNINFLIPHPETGVMTPVKDFMWTIPHCKWEEIINE